MKLQARHNPFVLAAILLIAARGPAVAQDPVPPAPDTVPAPSAPTETYCLRVENTQFGRIEVSLDGGERYLLLGRVQQPAAATAFDKSATKPGVVLRSSVNGLAFAVAPGQVLKLMPLTENEKPSARKAVQGGIQTDAEPKKAFFNDLLPPAGNTVLLQLSPKVLRPISEGYVPTQDDVFVFPVTLDFPAVKNEPPPAQSDPRYVAWLDGIKERWKAISQEYADQAMNRARASKRSVVSGILTLRARLPAGEPEPITAVTYSIDGDIVAAQNTFPSAFGWDTRRVPNGEHVVEIRALSRYASVVTKVRALVLVQNPEP